MEELMDECMSIERLIFEQNGMQTDGYWPGIDP
jgi:hypothetical protein